MLFNLTLTGHYGDSPEAPNYTTITDLCLDDSKPDAMIAAIQTFVDEFCTAERFECYTIMEHAAAKSRFFSNIINYLAGFNPDFDTRSYRWSLTTESCYVYDLRIAQDDHCDFLCGVEREAAFQHGETPACSHGKGSDGTPMFEVVGSLTYNAATDTLA